MIVCASWLCRAKQKTVVLYVSQCVDKCVFVVVRFTIVL
jgi:hypothetical protein